MTSTVTSFDEELVEAARRFLVAAEKNPDSRAVLTRYGYSAEEHARGHELTRDAVRAFQREREGTTWNFISTTPERRAAEARGWYEERLRRHAQSRFRAAELAAGWTGDGPASRWPLARKLTLGTLLALREAVGAASPRFFLEQRRTLADNLVRARTDRPADAPPPKDTVIVELRGWYERWHLLAHRVFRGRNDLLSPFGLVSGRAPPRLRGKAALQYGEKAASGLSVSLAEAEAEDSPETVVSTGDAPIVELSAPPAPPRAKSLPILH